MYLIEQELNGILIPYGINLHIVPTPEMLKKLKGLAMSKNVKIGALRKRFCKKCYSLFPINSQIRIKKGIKTLNCKKCGYVTRYKVK